MEGTETDLELLQGWRDGDVAAGDLLLGRHFTALHRFFANKVAGAADDLTQRTLLGCVEHHERFRGESSFRTYLFAIARNQLLAYLRRASNRQEHDELSQLTLQALGTSPSSALARNERELQLDLALTQLPLEQQLALELAYRYELTGPQIATVLEIEANTVRSRLARGRSALHKILAKRGIHVEDFSRPLPP